jgi:hypothetical protein
MRPLQIFLLLCAGVLGGALVTRVWLRPHSQLRTHAPAPAIAQVQPPSPAVQQPVAQPPAAEAPAPAAPAPAVETAPVPPERKPSPLPARLEVSRPRPTRAPPPPANPRPVDLGAKVGPPPPAPVVQAEPITAPALAPALAPPPARPEPENVTPAPPPAPELHKVTLNAGMLIPVRLVDGLSSERNVPGDTFSATLDRELVAEGFVIAERGARVDGRVLSVGNSTRMHGTSTLEVEITRIHTSDGQTVAVQTDSFERRAESNRGEDAAKIGGGAIIGAVIGGIAGGGKGAAIGAGVGGGAGAGGVLLTRGKPAKLPSETRINFRLRAPVTVTERRG